MTRGDVLVQQDDVSRRASLESNVERVANSRLAFDPYPFPFLTFVVSLEAIFLSIAVLISENRAMRLADRRANLDLQVNLLAEQESTATLQLVREIPECLGSRTADRKAADLAAETKVEEVLDHLERHLPMVRGGRVICRRFRDRRRLSERRGSVLWPAHLRGTQA